MLQVFLYSSKVITNASRQSCINTEHKWKGNREMQSCEAGKEKTKVTGIKQVCVDKVCEKAWENEDKQTGKRGKGNERSTWCTGGQKPK